jgi:hypothetical protein
METELFLCMRFGLIGAAAGAGYDGLRLFRRLCSHSILWLTIEDILFWVVVGVATYRLFFASTQGVIRGYGILGGTVGCLLYGKMVRPLFFPTLERRIRRWKTWIKNGKFSPKKRKKFVKSIDE